MWKGSNEFGIGKAQGRDGKWIVVANYYPAGNFLGRFAENVFPTGGSSKSGDDSKKADDSEKKEGNEKDKEEGKCPIL